MSKKYCYKKTKKNKQLGGMFDVTKIIPLENIEIPIIDPKLIGEGGFGAVVKLKIDKDTNVAVKLIKTTSKCLEAKIESSIHNEMYQTLKNLGKWLKDDDIYNFLYIPRPYSFYNYTSPKNIKLDKKTVETTCQYSMEFMKPINIVENIYQDQPIQLHIAMSDKIGLIQSMPYRGFMIGKNIPLYLKKIADVYPKYKKTNFNNILEAIGIAIGCAIFGCKYNPIDFQFMLSDHNGELKVIAFDFGLFEKIKEYDKKTIDDIYTNLSYSPYIGLLLNNHNEAIMILNGIAKTVKPFGIDSKEQDGYQLLFENFVEDYPEILS